MKSDIFSWKRGGLAIFCFLFSFIAHAQNGWSPKSIDTLSYAHFDADTLSFSLDTSNLVAFFQKFEKVATTRQGNINILHLGASHVQAGSMSHRIRRNILLADPEIIARRGMIFPYSAAAKCNNPADYKVSKTAPFALTRNVYKNIDRPLGVTGIAVSTADSLSEIKITMNDSQLTFTTERIVLLGFSDSNKVIPMVVVDTVSYLPAEVDTVLRRYVFDNIPAVTDSFKIRIVGKDSAVFTLTGILLDNDAQGITFHSLGVNGASVSSYLKCAYFESDMDLIRPDLVIFGIGINDAAASPFDTLEFERNYLKLIDKIKRVNPDCSFIFITNNDSYKKVSRKKYSVNTNGLLARRVFYRLAQETGGAVWDQFDIMGGLRSMDKWRMDKLAQTDRVHFTVKGYQLLGDLFYNAFLDAWSKSQTVYSTLN